MFDYKSTKSLQEFPQDFSADKIDLILILLSMDFARASTWATNGTAPTAIC
jgi:hypothetical protein